MGWVGSWLPGQGQRRETKAGDERKDRGEVKVWGLEVGEPEEVGEAWKRTKQVQGKMRLERSEE